MSALNMANAQQAYQEDTRLAHISLDDRLVLFDPDGRFSASLNEVWSVIKDNVQEQVEAAAQMLLHHPAFKAVLSAQPLQAMLKRGIERTAYKYTHPLNQEWVSELVEIGTLCRKYNAPRHIAVATVHAGSSVFRRAAMDRLKHDPAKMKRVIQTISQLEVFEIELITTKMSQLDAQDELSRLAHHSEDFEQKVMATVSMIAASSAQLRAEAEAAADESRDMLKRSTDVASATGQSTIAMREAAKLAAQLTTVIDMTHEDIGRAATDAADAAEQSETTMNTVTTLAHSAKEIASVLSLIKNIAGQTNLLALNATIEAARAGDAGRGFSVVAQEVKLLAGQVAKATDEIARQINTIQIISEKAVAATRSVVDRVVQIHGSASQMQSTISGQKNSVFAINSAVEETAYSADDIAVNIENMRAASERMAGKMADINSGTVSVDNMLAKLRNDIDIFRVALNVAA
jgi:methyl-accepting chemotaxis protein